MDNTQIRQFLKRSREWSRAKRGFEMASIAANDMRAVGAVDSGFFVYKRRFPSRASIPEKPSVFVPWGVFEGHELTLQRMVDSYSNFMDTPVSLMERWMVPGDDLPAELDGLRDAFQLLEVGVWPLVSRGERTGCIVVARTQPDNRVSMQTRTMIVDACAAQLSLALDLYLMGRIAEDASHRDLLTGLLNRRGVETRLTHLTSHAAKSGSRLVFGLIDLNDLKVVNDTQGHPAGDSALRQVADILSRNVGADDIVARWGGDEFAVILHTYESDAGAVMVRLQEAVDTQSSGHCVSVGGAVWGIDGTTLQECLQAADERLYDCKRLTKLQP